MMFIKRQVNIISIAEKRNNYLCKLSGYSVTEQFIISDYMKKLTVFSLPCSVVHLLMAQTNQKNTLLDNKTKKKVKFICLA